MSTILKCFGILIAPFVLVWIISLIVSINKYSITDKSNNVKDDILFKKAVGRLRSWFISMTFWTLAEYLFVVIPFVANVVVIYLSAFYGSNTKIITVLSSISLTFIVFGFAVKPQRHMICYRKAYDVLDDAINEYIFKTDKAETNDKLIKALKTGEGFIDFSYDTE